MGERFLRRLPNGLHRRTVPHGVDESGLDVFGLFRQNRTLRGGVAPVRAYAEELLDSVPEGYRAMDEHEAVKVLVTP